MYTFGCDPELQIRDGRRRFLEAWEVMDSHRGAFGTDGSIFEIRPGWSTDVLDIVQSIYEIFKKAYQNIFALREGAWMVGHYQGNEALGGHIHIGGVHIKGAPDTSEEWDTEFGDYDGYSFQEGSDLYNYVHALKIGLYNGLSEFWDNKGQRERRQSYSGYGKPWNTRVTRDRPQGTITHIEYRSPGSFIISPKVTLITLAAAKVITKVHFEDKEFFNREGFDSITPYGIVQRLQRLMSDVGGADLTMAAKALDSTLRNFKRINWNIDIRKTWRII